MANTNLPPLTKQDLFGFRTTPGKIIYRLRPYKRNTQRIGEFYKAVNYKPTSSGNKKVFSENHKEFFKQLVDFAKDDDSFKTLSNDQKTKVAKSLVKMADQLYFQGDSFGRDELIKIADSKYTELRKTDKLLYKHMTPSEFLTIQLHYGCSISLNNIKPAANDFVQIPITAMKPISPGTLKIDQNTPDVGQTTPQTHKHTLTLSKQETGTTSSRDTEHSADFIQIPITVMSPISPRTLKIDQNTPDVGQNTPQISKTPEISKIGLTDTYKPNKSNIIPDAEDLDNCTYGFQENRNHSTLEESETEPARVLDLKTETSDIGLLPLPHYTVSFNKCGQRQITATYVIEGVGTISFDQKPRITQQTQC